MRKRIIYAGVTIALAAGTFFLGKNMDTRTPVQTMENALSSVNEWKVENNILYLYTVDGNYYSLEK